MARFLVLFSNTHYDATRRGHTRTICMTGLRFEPSVYKAVLSLPPLAYAEAPTAV
jgi:hypothetical protein